MDRADHHCDSDDQQGGIEREWIVWCASIFGTVWVDGADDYDG